MGLGREQGEAIMLLPAWDVAPLSSLTLPHPPNSSNLAPERRHCCLSWLCGGDIVVQIPVVVQLSLGAAGSACTI